MVAVPNQTFRVRDPGLAQTPEAIESFLYLGTSSLGVCNRVYSFNDLNTAADTLDQGALSEVVTRHASIAGGPVLAMRLFHDVAAVIGSVTKEPASGVTSTGTIAVTTTPQDASKVWQIDDPAGTPVYTDFTADLADAGAADVTIFPTTELAGDQFAIGFTSPFAKVVTTLSTVGVGGTITWKYWNGTAWTAVTGTAGAGAGLLASGAVTWTMPTDWQPKSINGSAELYYVVAEVATVFSTNPIGTSAYIDNHGPHDSYNIEIPIIQTGTLGAGTFKYTLDEGYEYSPELTIPSGGVYDIPSTGLRVTFTPGGGPSYFAAGDNFVLTTTAPFFSTTALASAFTAVRASTSDFAAVVIAGRPASGAAAATLEAAFATHLATLETEKRFVGGIMDGGKDTATAVKAAFLNLSSSRVVVCFTDDEADIETDITTGRVKNRWRFASAKPFAGWSTPRRSFVNAFAVRAGESLISTHQGRFADGTIEGAVTIGYNEEKGSAAMSAARFCTGRSWQGFLGGFYINRPNTLAAPGSNFDLWPYRRMGDVACSTGHRALQRFMNTKVRVLVDGTGRIDPREALRIEGEINAALAQNLTVPLDAEGNRGHLAAVSYRIDLEHNVRDTNQVVGFIAMVRDGYAEEILTTLGFAATAV